MRCSGCGKDIPYHGEVCPFCLRDKSADQQSMGCISIALIAGGVLGYLTFDFMGMIIAAFAAGIAAAIITSFGAQEAAKKPPAVRVDSVTQPVEFSKADAPSSIEGSVENRLDRLEQLRSKGLITETEYSDRRRGILDSL